MSSISLISQENNIKESEKETIRGGGEAEIVSQEGTKPKKNVLDMTDEEYAEYRKQKKTMQEKNDKKNKQEQIVVQSSSPVEKGDDYGIYGEFNDYSTNSEDYGSYGEFGGGFVPYQGESVIAQEVGDALKVMYVTKLADGNFRVTYDTVNSQRRVEVLSPVQYNFLLRDCQVNAKALYEQERQRQQINQTVKDYNKTVDRAEKKFRKAEKKAEKEYYEDLAENYKYLRQSVQYDHNLKKYYRNMENKAKRKAKGKK